LITGINSYIGSSLKKWLEVSEDSVEISEISLKNTTLHKLDLSEFDVVFHVAGIAHSNAKKQNLKQDDRYYEVNTLLTINLAKLAKKSGVKQFVFMSSMIVYGAPYPLKIVKPIDKFTKPAPFNAYGNSKLQAELGLKELESDVFNIAIIRSPMVYGQNSKGNYPLLAKFAKKSPIFPNIDNKKSVIHIDNLCEFIRLIIKNDDTGIFHPQNKEVVSTSMIVETIANYHDSKIILTRIFNPILHLVTNVNLIKKVFGNYYYDAEISVYKDDYQCLNFHDSIAETEKSTSK